MKALKKNEDGKYVCEECGRICGESNALSKHISTHHNPKLYYNKWRKTEGEGICKICNNETSFISVGQGYKNCCSKDCKNKYTFKNIKDATFKKYGVENIYQSKLIKNRIKELHGDECAWKCEDVINKIKKQNPSIQDKKRATCKKKYGVEHNSQTDNFKEKRIKTWIKKYGVENPSQNKEISDKTFKTRLLLKYFKDTELSYQASYELDFLEKYSQKIEIKNGPSIKYILDGRNKVYHSDFYIPVLNLIIEIKNSWLRKRDDIEIIEKEKAAIKNGYRYIIIIDKNYDEFNKILDNHVTISTL